MCQIVVNVGCHLSVSIICTVHTVIPKLSQILCEKMFWWKKKTTPETMKNSGKSTHNSPKRRKQTHTHKNPPDKLDTRCSFVDIKNLPYENESHVSLQLNTIVIISQYLSVSEVDRIEN